VKLRLRVQLRLVRRGAYRILVQCRAKIVTYIHTYICIYVTASRRFIARASESLAVGTSKYRPQDVIFPAFYLFPSLTHQRSATQIAIHVQTICPIRPIISNLPSSSDRTPRSRRFLCAMRRSEIEDPGRSATGSPGSLEAPRYILDAMLIP